MPNIPWAAIVIPAAAYVVLFPLNTWMSQNLDMAPRIGRFFFNSYNAVIWIFAMVIWVVSSLLWAVISYRAAGWWCFAATVILCHPWNSDSPQLVKFLVAVARPGGSWFTFRPRSPTIVGQRLTAARLRLNGWDDIRRYRDTTIEALNVTYEEYYDRDPAVRKALAFWHSMEGIPDFIDDQATREFQWRERLHVQMKPVMFEALNKITSAIDREIYRHLPPMYTPDDGTAPAFDIHIGLMVTNSLIHQIVEPILAQAIVDIDRNLRDIEDAKNVEMEPFLERTVGPAVQHMVDTVLRDIPTSFKSAEKRATKTNTHNPDTPNRPPINVKDHPAASTWTNTTFAPPSPPQSHRKQKPRATNENGFSSASAPGSPMPGGPSGIGGDDDGEEGF